jgi:tubulin-specific chaperone A
MPPQSPLAVATASVQRLVKEEASYHRELESQQKRIEKLEAETASGQPDEDGNRQYILNQEVRAEPKALRSLDGQVP